LYFSGSQKKSSFGNANGDGDSRDENNLEEGVQDLFAIIPNGKGNDMSNNNPTRPQNSRSGSSRFNRGNRYSRNNNRNKRKGSDGIIKDGAVPVSSLLPPPINFKSKDQSSNNDGPTGDDTVSQGLSSWEDFLGGAPSSSTSELSAKRQTENETRGLGRAKPSNQNGNIAPPENDSKDMLPSIADLFPSDMSTTKSASFESSGSNGDSTGSSSTPALDGVLPVSDLFYRSVQSMSDDDQNADEDPSEQRDDEELPFSAEQSDQLTSSLNKIKIRRNGARSKRFATTGTTTNRNQPNSPPRKRKLQRRGMEMLVGGVPINADPPQRSVELYYKHDRAVDWKEVITTNSRDFGPMHYGPSVNKLSEAEHGLFCEFFVNSTLKWNVCPKDLRSFVNKNGDIFVEETKPETEADPKAGAENSTRIGESLSLNTTESTMKEALRNRLVGSMKEAFSRASTFEDPKKQPLSVNSEAQLSGELVFSIGVSKEELEESSGDSKSAKSVLEQVLARGILMSSECTAFDVQFSELKLVDLEDGTTKISAEFVLTIKNNESMSFAEVKKKCNEINSSLAQAMDDGEMQLAMAAAAKEEKTWSEEFRNRIVEEFLFDDDDGDGPLDDDSVVGKSSTTKSANSNGSSQQAEAKPNLESTIDSLLNDLNFEVQGFQNDQKDVPFGMPGSPVYSNDDIFLGGGNDGVFWNYASGNVLQSPYQGKLGLRMVEAVTEKAKQRHPRVIAIGDVHGCIDELQDLLRECDYRPGDVVVFLGDLVSKGPDSMAVVQMAREIGAIGVRGNHDFEVVRWHQAIMSGVDPPVVGSEHYHIANCLTKADMKWMYSLPWFISSQDLGALFVHAGFVSGIRLAKQNPRLMMNMRSILPDGTVTSKFFNNWPWARLWDGPQTVLFGHDADRGLQQYEHAIGLDTGCVYGGRLTACILPEKRLVSVSAKREYFKYRRKHYD